MRLLRYIQWACWALCVACAPVLKGPLDTGTPEQRSATLGHGYAVLAGILHDESDATLIFGVKHASADVQAIVRNISDAAADTHRAVWAMREAKPPIDLEDTGLGLIETSVRNHMRNQEAGALLLAGASFEVRLLLGQQKACDYIAALAKTLATADPNEERADLMRRTAQRFAALDVEVRAMFEVRQAESSSKSGS